MVELCMGVPVIVPTKADEGFHLSGTSLRRALESNPRTSAIILCNPSNPTGKNMARDHLREIADVLADFPSVAIISDEIYERLVYDGEEHWSFVSVAPELYDRTITINGCSKSHAMTGFRIGYCATSAFLSKHIAKLQSQLTSCASSISQAAALAALEDPRIDASHWLQSRVRELQEKRDLALELLNVIPDVAVDKPTGAFYLLPDVHRYYGRSVALEDGTQAVIRNSNDLCETLLRVEKVALVPGSCFGDDRCVRISYAASKDVIREAIPRLARFLRSLRS
jgi:aspartate/methionine/tyrosine aminotransferase|eukprot:gene9730-6965_t